MTPTEAEREKAREIVAIWAREGLLNKSHSELPAYTSALANEFAFVRGEALAAARAQGWREGIEAAAKIADDLRAQFAGHDGDDACVSCAEAIRNLKQPQEPPHAP